MGVRAALLQSERNDIRLSIWHAGHPSDLIPGLPDALVESEIWPRIREYFEDIGTEPESNDLRKKMMAIRSLQNASRKWRFVVRGSKSWAAMRILEYNLGPIPNWWSTDYIVFFFHRYMRNLPPIDTFSTDTIDQLSFWFKCWHDMSHDDREMCLELYDVKNDTLGRLVAWKTERDAWSDGCSFADTIQTRCFPCLFH